MSPSISVIMPAYNAERTIELALRSIRMQTIAEQIEILVIDGGSTVWCCDFGKSSSFAGTGKADWHPTG